MNQLQTQRIDKLEVEINYYKAQTAQNIIEIGNRLIEAKELLPHGEWGNWLEIKVDFSDRRARQFMQVAREFGNRQLSSDLSLDKMLLLTNIEADERQGFIESNPVEDMTTRELRQAIKEKKELQEEVDKLLRRPREIKEIEVIPSDYNSLKQTVTKLERQLVDKDLELEQAEQTKKILERKVKLNEEEAKKYQSLTTQINQLSKQKDDLGRQIKARTELSGLVVKIEHILKTELAPVKYSRAINEARQDEIVVKNLEEIVSRVEDWCQEMRRLLPGEYIQGVKYEQTY